MDILGYEIDIYLVIVVLAGIVVLSIIMLISNTLKGNKPSSKKGKGELKQGNKRGKPPVLSLAKNQGTPPQAEKLLPAPANKLPEELPTTSIPKTSNEIPSSPSGETAAAGKSAPAGTEMGKRVTTDTEAAQSTPAGANAEKSTAPVTRLWDTGTAQGTKEEAKEELEENDKDGGLLDIFDEEDVEDTGLEELAGLLADVDVDTLKQLSSEVAQMLAKRETGSQRRL